MEITRKDLDTIINALGRAIEDIQKEENFLEYGGLQFEYFDYVTLKEKLGNI